ncbi:MAG: hypothetical protein GWN00_01490 [Aliifodinibius sp.]|nr:hypothetical protein [Phycisphaerae bacterium]NIR62353.1 hypothetical protein [candidate division Zixibacteria bacterium]NIT54952.1 hypothetical protein [Fodinibius sp.]NIW43364.1 hypothetical protein [Gammaproteobacteria bacterium]NIU12586.1 hypothetical protein [candidate division Zixibacteria bacterium]
MANLTDRNLGIVTVSKHSIEDSPEMVLKAFQIAGFLPLRVEHCLIQNLFIYTGLCKAFPEVSDGEKIPRYTMTAYYQDGDIENIEFTAEG